MDKTPETVIGRNSRAVNVQATTRVNSGGSVRRARMNALYRFLIYCCEAEVTVLIMQEPAANYGNCKRLKPLADICLWMLCMCGCMCARYVAEIVVEASFGW